MALIFIHILTYLEDELAWRNLGRLLGATCKFQSSTFSFFPLNDARFLTYFFLAVSAVAAGTGAAVGAGAVTATTGAAIGATAGGVAAAATGGGAAAVTVGAATGAGTISSAMVSAGLAGSALGPLGTLFFCFEEDTLVIKRDGTNAKVGDLGVGDEILSKAELDGQFSADIFATVTNATKIAGSFPAHKIMFSNDNHITVTSPHLMIIKSDKESMKLVAARDVKPLDEMVFSDGSFYQIEKIEDVVLPIKVNIETSTGLLFANGFLTSGMCENTPDLDNNAKDVLRDYMVSHLNNAVVV